MQMICQAVFGVYIAVEIIIAAVRAFHLYHSVFYSLIDKQTFYFFSYGIRLADLLVRDLNMPRKCGNAVPDGPYMHVVNGLHFRNSLRSSPRCPPHEILRD